jgi:hypothetical protein
MPQRSVVEYHGISGSEGGILRGKPPLIATEDCYIEPSVPV